MDQGPSQRDFVTAVRLLNHYLHYMADLGVKGFDCSQTTIESVKNWGKPRKRISPRIIEGHEIKEPIESIIKDLSACESCPERQIGKGRVSGNGNPNARLMFVGESPDYEDSMTEMPFSGEAGRLLTKMIEAMGLTRDDVYITHAVKCYSTVTRRPAPEAVRACLPFLEREIMVVQPEIICTLGAFATQAVLGKRDHVADMRGHFHEYRTMKVLPTFHPAFLMKHPANKREAWADLKKIMDALGLKQPGK